jgi:hypothetical protein
MRYYDANSEFERIREIISDEIRSGVNSLTASRLIQKYDLSPNSVQQVLTDLASVGDLETHYWVLCCGEHQNFDVDREFSKESDIPNYSITCNTCQDLYTPQREHIFVSFEPTASFKKYLQEAS